MNYLIPILLAASFAIGCSERQQRPSDPVAGREIIELEDGKGYILKSADHHTPQIEISISKDSYGIAQLSDDGNPPIVIRMEGGIIELIHSRVEDGNEITVTDEDGDGLADLRLILPQDKAQRRQAKIEDITHQFSERKRKQRDGGEQDESLRP
jgi:hypothetical protein